MSKLYTYQHNNCLVRDGGRSIPAIAVIRTTSTEAAADAIGVPAATFWQSGGTRWVPGVVTGHHGSVEPA
jgi:hypothetical protein